MILPGFGKDMRNNYLTMDEFLNSDWLNNYENSFFKVDVESTVTDSYLFTKIK